MKRTTSILWIVMATLFAADGSAETNIEAAYARLPLGFERNRSRWHTGVASYRRVRYSRVWPGIDLVWHGTRSALGYDFIVRPGSDPARIRVAFDGVERLWLGSAGNLIAKTAAREVLQSAPVVY